MLNSSCLYIFKHPIKPLVSAKTRTNFLLAQPNGGNQAKAFKQPFEKG